MKLKKKTEKKEKRQKTFAYRRLFSVVFRTLCFLQRSTLLIELRSKQPRSLAELVFRSKHLRQLQQQLIIRLVSQLPRHLPARRPHSQHPL
jgi:hypothetical protein